MALLGKRQICLYYESWCVSFCIVSMFTCYSILLAFSFIFTVSENIIATTKMRNNYVII